MMPTVVKNAAIWSSGWSVRRDWRTNLRLRRDSLALTCSINGRIPLIPRVKVTAFRVKARVAYPASRDVMLGCWEERTMRTEQCRGVSRGWEWVCGHKRRGQPNRGPPFLYLRHSCAATGSSISG